MNSMPSDPAYRSVSFWMDTAPGSLAPGEVLPGDLAVDVAIAGAGLTGLWTAYYLVTAQPGLRVAVCDAGNSAEHQPPLRPDAPNPAISASHTATRRPGWAVTR